MTLQEMADYAMDYLDSKGIAADYVIEERHTDLFIPYSKGETKRIKYSVLLVSFLDLVVELTALHGINIAKARHRIKSTIDLHLTSNK